MAADFETLTHVSASPSHGPGPGPAPLAPGDRRAVEIAVVLDDSVVAVHHLSPSPGRTSVATRVLAAGALLGLALFISQAVIAVRIARENRQALRLWLEDGNAQLELRARQLSPLADLAAGLGLVSGLGLGIWALVRAGRERRRSDFRIGELTVVGFRDGEPMFTPAPGMTGEITVSGQPRPFEAGPLARGGRVRAVHGAASYLISSVAPPRPAAGVGAAVDRRALGYAGASFAAHAVVVVLSFLLPADASGYASDDLAAARRRVQIQFMPSEDPRLQPGNNGSSAPGGEPGPSGATGVREAQNQHGLRKVKRVQDEPTVARPVEARAARSAGILGILNARRESLTAVTAMNDFPSGLDDEDLRGGYLGDPYGDARGWGTGPIGSGPRGGGPYPGTIGTGPIRTGPVGVMELPPGGLPGRRPNPTFVIGPPTVPEGIDKNMVRRYVRQKHQQISHCYERQLTVQPGLLGTTTTSFTIDQNGRVIEARARGLGAPAVERCLEDVLRSIQFPKGGIVNVTSYPFTFHPVGG